MFDILIRNGWVIDGRQTPRYQADIGLNGERITAVGNLAEAEARHTIEAAGCIVAPGFIDVHTHSDGWLQHHPHFFSKTIQGFTTEFLMLDGISYAPVNEQTWREWFQYLRPLNGLQLHDYSGWQTIGDYMALLDGRAAQNTAAFIPYANVRTLACGFGQRIPDDYQMFEIKRLIQQGMADGALGLSTGLDYMDEWFASTDELVAACRMMAPDGVYVTHVRYALGTLEGVKEAVDIGRRAGVPVHISHLKATSQAETETILQYIDSVAVNEVDFSFDVYPYVPSSTMLKTLLPYEVWLDGPIAALQKLTVPRIRASFARTLADMPLDDVRIAWVATKANGRYQGYSLAHYVAETGKPPADALCDLLLEEGMAVLLVFHFGEDDLVAPFLAHDCYMMGSDGIYFPGAMTHPRQYGSSGRLLGHWVREKRLFSLETAVAKLSDFPARRFNLKARGAIQDGYFADLVIFDEQAIIDRATYADPQKVTVGVKDVLVNGQVIIQEGKKVTGRMPGKYLNLEL